ncbi:MAG: hypothetical protein ABR549_13665 [Mycobacteriales bacterium]
MAHPPDLIATVVAEACRKDPSLPPEAAEQLARQALACDPGTDAPEIARSLLAKQDGLDVSWANAIATAVSELRS